MTGKSNQKACDQVRKSLGTPLLTKTAVSKRPGWSKSVMDKLLGEPDKTKRHETFGTLIYLYSAERVFQIEEMPEFKQGLSQNIKRREAAKKAVKTKREDLFSKIDSMKIHVKSLPLRDVRNKAVKSYNNRNIDNIVPNKNNQGFIDRITVNYIRHHLTEYDRVLDDVAGKIGSVDGRVRIWKRIFPEIGLTYPQLKEECRRQLRRKIEDEKNLSSYEG